MPTCAPSQSRFRVTETVCLLEDWAQHEGPRGGTYWVKDGNPESKTYRKPQGTDSPDAATDDGGSRAFPIAQAAQPKANGDRDSSLQGISVADDDFDRSVTKTPQFKVWFNRSKAVSPDGTPLILWHGTLADVFDAFQPSPRDIGIHFGTLEQAEKRLDVLAEPQRQAGNPEPEYSYVPVYLSLQNPLVLKDDVTGAETPAALLFGLRNAGGLPQEQFLPIIRRLEAERSATYAEATQHAESRIASGELTPEFSITFIRGSTFGDQYSSHARLRDRSGRVVAMLDDQSKLDPHKVPGKNSDLELKVRIADSKRDGLVHILAKEEMHRRQYRMIEEELKSLGYDGLIYPNKVEGQGLSYAVFDPEQVKSAEQSGYDPRSGKLTEAWTKIRGKRGSQNLWQDETGRQVYSRTEPGRREAADAGGKTDAQRPFDAGLTPGHKPPATETPEFRRWFGDSKVVDGSGKPLVVYHGTRREFDAFDPTKLGSASGHPLSVFGAFFTTSPQVADLFSKDIPDVPFPDVPAAPHSEGAATMPVYLAIRNPKVISAEEFRNALPVHQVYNQEAEDETGNAFVKTEKQLRAIRDAWMKEGYDGLLITKDPRARPGMGMDEWVADQWVAFRPEQIKSVTGNRGTFDPRSPKITESRTVREEVAFEGWVRDGRRVSPSREKAHLGESRQVTLFEACGWDGAALRDGLLEEWTPYHGPLGGTGWQWNGQGEPVYQDEMPGEPREPGGKSQRDLFDRDPQVSPPRPEVRPSPAAPSAPPIRQPEPDKSDLGGGTIATDRGEREARYRDMRRSRKNPLVEFPKPIVGPSGAKLTSYEWKYEIYDYVDERGEERKKRVSAWDEAVGSDDTGRDIVHHFHITDKDGRAQVVSLESALKVLGYLKRDAKTPGVANIKTLASALKRRAVAQMDLDRQQDLFERVDGVMRDVRKKVEALPRPEIVLDREKRGWMSNDAIARGEPDWVPVWRMGDTTIEILTGDGKPDYRRETLPFGGAAPTDGERKYLLANWMNRRMTEDLPSELVAEYRAAGNSRLTPGDWDRYDRQNAKAELDKRERKIGDLDRQIQILADEAAETAAGGKSGPEKHRAALRQLDEVWDTLQLGADGRKYADPVEAAKTHLKANGTENWNDRGRESGAYEMQEIVDELKALTSRGWDGRKTGKALLADETPATERYGKPIPAVPPSPDKKVTKWYMENKEAIEDVLQRLEKWKRQYRPERAAESQVREGWITLNAGSGDDEEGGVRVYIDDGSGKVTAGPEGLMGKAFPEARGKSRPVAQLREPDATKAGGQTGDTQVGPAKPEVPKEQSPVEPPAEIARSPGMPVLRFPKPIVGPSGARLESYEWKYTTEEDEQAGKRRVSDWAQAVGSDRTGRDIVHQFHVVDRDGNRKVVSLDSALKELGYVPADAKTAPVKGIKDLGTALKRRGLAQLEIDRREDLQRRFDAALEKINREVAALPVPAAEKIEDQDGYSRHRIGDVEQRQAQTGGLTGDVQRELEQEWRKLRTAERFPLDLGREAAEAVGLPGNDTEARAMASMGLRYFKDDTAKKRQQLRRLDQKIEELAGHASRMAESAWCRQVTLFEAWSQHEGPRGGTYWLKDGDRESKTYRRPSDRDDSRLATTKADQPTSYRVEARGQQYVVRPEAQQRDPHGRLSGDFTQRELAAHVIDRELGGRLIPRTEFTHAAGGQAIQQPLVAGESPAALSDLPPGTQQTMAAFDFIIGAANRRPDQVKLDPDGRPQLVSNGRAFYSNGDLAEIGFGDAAQRPAELGGEGLAVAEMVLSYEQQLRPQLMMLLPEPQVSDLFTRAKMLIRNQRNLRELFSADGFAAALEVQQVGFPTVSPTPLSDDPETWGETPADREIPDAMHDRAFVGADRYEEYAIRFNQSLRRELGQEPARDDRLGAERDMTPHWPAKIRQDVTQRIPDPEGALDRKADRLLTALGERAVGLGGKTALEKVTGAVISAINEPAQANRDLAQAIQYAAAERFGGQVPAWADRTLYDQDPELFHAIAQGIYDNTQNRLRAARIPGLVVYRGLDLTPQPEEFRRLWDTAATGRGAVRAVDDVQVNQQPVASWTQNPYLAHNAAVGYGSNRQMVLGAWVPAEKIFSLPFSGPGDASSQEVLTLGEYKPERTRAVLFNDWRYSLEEKHMMGPLSAVGSHSHEWFWGENPALTENPQDTTAPHGQRKGEEGGFMYAAGDEPEPGLKVLRPHSVEQDGDQRVESYLAMDQRGGSEARTILLQVRAKPYRAAETWIPYHGPLGGKGWQDTTTGEIDYGTEQPGRGHGTGDGQSADLRGDQPPGSRDGGLRATAGRLGDTQLSGAVSGSGAAGAKDSELRGLDRDTLLDQRQMYADNIEMKRSKGEDVPQAWLDGMAKLDTQLKQLDATAGQSPADAGTPKPAVIETPEFKSWFGKSKIVNPDGTPRVLYHGTLYQWDDASKFDPRKGELGIHLGEQEIANLFAKSIGMPNDAPRMYPVYVSLQNPLRLQDNGSWGWGTLNQRPDLFPREEVTAAWKAGKKPQDVIKAKGFDGVEYINRRETPISSLELSKRLGGPDENERRVNAMTDEEFLAKVPEATMSYIVFDADQIKSPYNRGTWERGNPNISESGQARRPVVREILLDRDPAIAGWLHRYRVFQASEGWVEYKGPRGGTYWLKDGDRATKTYRKPQDMETPEAKPAAPVADAGKPAIGGGAPTSPPRGGVEVPGQADVTENGIRFATGTPVRFQFLRNTEKAPRTSKFGQDIEPSGRYLTHNSYPNPQGPPPGWETGEVAFQNPLVLAHDEQDLYGPKGWKARLSEAFGGLTGKSLSQAVADAGFDGIVTVKPSYGETSEIVDLSMFRRDPSEKTTPATNEPVASKTDTPEFKNWFGDSKVVDGDGKPLVVYHGSLRSFDEFDATRHGETTQNDGWYGSGFYLSSSADKAGHYARDPVTGRQATPEAFYVSMQRPFVIGNPGSVDFVSGEVERAFNARGLGDLSWVTPYKAASEAIDAFGRQEFTELLKSLGYDGVIVGNGVTGSGGDAFHEVVVFDPRQIKSATRNRGSFDPKSPKITESVPLETHPLLHEGWIEYDGPLGGEGWKNTETGKVRYVEERPGGGRSECGMAEPKSDGTQDKYRDTSVEPTAATSPVQTSGRGFVTPSLYDSLSETGLPVHHIEQLSMFGIATPSIHELTSEETQQVVVTQLGPDAIVNDVLNEEGALTPDGRLLLFHGTPPTNELLKPDVSGYVYLSNAFGPAKWYAHTRHGDGPVHAYTIGSSKKIIGIEDISDLKDVLSQLGHHDIVRKIDWNVPVDEQVVYEWIRIPEIAKAFKKSGIDAIRIPDNSNGYQHTTWAVLNHRLLHRLTPKQEDLTEPSPVTNHLQIAPDAATEQPGIASPAITASEPSSPKSPSDIPVVDEFQPDPVRFKVRGSGEWEWDGEAPVVKGPLGGMPHYRVTRLEDGRQGTLTSYGREGWRIDLDGDSSYRPVARGGGRNPIEAKQKAERQTETRSREGDREAGESGRKAALQMMDMALENVQTVQGLSPEEASRLQPKIEETKTVARAAWAKVIDRFGPKALEAIGQVSKVTLYADQIELAASLVRWDKSADETRGIQGVYRHDDKTGELLLSGAGVVDPEGTYAHELTHAVDGPQSVYSSARKWRNAWKAEIGDREENKIRRVKLPSGEVKELVGKAAEEVQVGDKVLLGDGVAKAVLSARLYTKGRFGKVFEVMLEGEDSPRIWRPDASYVMADSPEAPAAPLTRYAQTSASEGLAEFGRLLVAYPARAKREFPKCWKCWREWHLVEEPTAGESATTGRLREYVAFEVWDESKYERDKEGQFAKKGTGVGDSANIEGERANNQQQDRGMNDYEGIPGQDRNLPGTTIRLSDGSPKVFYRGSRYSSAKYDPKLSKGMIFFTPEKDYAEHFGEIVHEVYISPNAVLDLTGFGAEDDVPRERLLDELREAGVDTGGLRLASRAEMLQHLSQGPAAGEIARRAKAAGYDAIVLNEYVLDGGETESWAVLDEGIIHELT